MFSVRLVQAVKVVEPDSVNRWTVPVLVKFDTTSILSDAISDVALDAGYIVLSSEATQRLRNCGLLIVPTLEIPATRLLNLIHGVSPRHLRQTRNWLDAEHRRMVARQQNSRKTARRNLHHGKQKETDVAGEEMEEVINKRQEGNHLQH
jgi:hypothetical protein